MHVGDRVRIGSSHLFEFATVFDVPVTCFFDEMLSAMKSAHTRKNATTVARRLLVYKGLKQIAGEQTETYCARASA
jgi:hypothetical protein